MRHGVQLAIGRSLHFVVILIIKIAVFLVAALIFMFKQLIVPLFSTKTIKKVISIFLHSSCILLNRSSFSFPTFVVFDFKIMIM